MNYGESLLKYLALWQNYFENTGYDFFNVISSIFPLKPARVITIDQQ